MDLATSALMPWFARPTVSATRAHSENTYRCAATVTSRARLVLLGTMPSAGGRGAAVSQLSCPAGKPVVISTTLACCVVFHGRLELGSPSSRHTWRAEEQRTGPTRVSPSRKHVTSGRACASSEDRDAGAHHGRPAVGLLRVAGDMQAEALPRYVLQLRSRRERRRTQGSAHAFSRECGQQSAVSTTQA